MTDTYLGYPMDPEGHVSGELPPEFATELWGEKEEIWSHMIEDAGYEVHCIRGEDEPDMMDDGGDVVAEVLREREPTPPAGEGWKLAWRAVDEDGPNVCFWRDRPSSVPVSGEE